MRDIRSDLQDRVNLVEKEITAAVTHFEKAVEQLQSECDARVARLKAELAVLGALIESEHQRMASVPRPIESEHQRMPNDPRPIESEHQRMPSVPRAIESEHQRMPNDPRPIESEHQRMSSVPRPIESEHQRMPNDPRPIESEHQRRPNDLRAVESEHQRMPNDLRAVESEHQRMPNDPGAIESEHQRRSNDLRAMALPRHSLADFIARKLAEIGPRSKADLSSFAVREGYFRDIEHAGPGVHATLVDLLRSDHIRQLPDGTLAPATLSQMFRRQGV